MLVAWIQGMRNFMDDSILDILVVILLQMIPGQLDSLGAVLAQTDGPTAFGDHCPPSRQAAVL